MAKAITTIPREESEPRVETGPIQFGNDWPGVFLRGDDAFAYASALEQALRPDHDFAAVSMMEGLARTLRGCVIGASSELLRSFAGAPTLDLEGVREVRQRCGEAHSPSQPECILGVGDGSGRLFVHGNYDSIRAARAIIFERDLLLSAVGRFLKACASVETSHVVTHAAGSPHQCFERGWLRAQQFVRQLVEDGERAAS